MDLEEALQTQTRIADFLRNALRRREPAKPHVAIGIAPSDASFFKVALRAPSQEVLHQVLGEGGAKEVNKIAGYEIAIDITGEILADLTQYARTGSTSLMIGASVCHYRGTAGSVGFFAQRLSDGNIGFVSNNHVIADCDRGEGCDDILHPRPIDGGKRSTNTVADLVKGYPPLERNGTVVDAAFARLRNGVDYDATSIGPSLRLQPLLVRLYKQRDVLKVGRSTGLTRGRISAFALQNLHVDYPALDTRIIVNRQIEITSDDRAAPFSRPGDNGSLVVTLEGYPIGPLFASTHNGRYSYANPIADVLRELDIRFLT